MGCLASGDYLSGDQSFLVHIPCAAAACLLLLQETGVDLTGLRCVIIGRGRLIGIPVASLMQWSAKATVTTCHQQTIDMEKEIGRAQIIISGAGSPGLVKGRWIRKDTLVIDCGVNVIPGR